ncbi:unnamed protein product [Mycena citricolor]|uniref:M-phase inducer phosphatase n=1 Tax=Mycena citricolor TaxID=2018698 RepID=A0AAD2HK78_9AGAR|nr:unnamed protein product [Mycena citricolor]
MAFVAQSSKFLSIPRARAELPSRELEDLSSDLELSFASNVSLNSPPRLSLPLTPESEYPKPMDISPLPPVMFMRPRALTSDSRMFGQDRSNEWGQASQVQLGDVSGSSKVGSTLSGKRTQRSALPTEWFQLPQQDSSPALVRQLSDDAMDVDSSYEAPLLSIVAPQSAAPTITAFSNIFYDMSPVAPQPKKQRRSLSPDHLNTFASPGSSSPPQASSPTQYKTDRLAAAAVIEKPVPAFGPILGLKRPRRPALSGVAQTAYPTVDGDHGLPCPAGRPLPPARRAFSAVIPPSSLNSQLPDAVSDDSSFEGTSSPAQAYAKRQHMKTLRRRDGTDDFRPLTGATAMILNESPSAKFLTAGMPGFGDNEASGKLLPCHRVTEDGLMRITPDTLNQLLDGHFSSRADYHIIDCRFDYEYNGGHIQGAINLNQVGDVEEFLLRETLVKPKASVSGDPARKTILVFHCEFSAKRAPTFAKHLRAKDRAINNHVYPKIHYPELYILEGGYCRYFQNASVRCQPQAYVRMDDPAHTTSRDGGLDALRKTKFGRHKSYAYGDAVNKTSASSSTQNPQSKRNTLPAGPGSMFAAANAARTRRGGSLMPLSEDGHGPTDAEETDEDLGDSPCPPANKGIRKGPRTLARTDTC